MRTRFSPLSAAGALAWSLLPGTTLAQHSGLPPMPDDLGRFWQVIKHTKEHGGARLISCGPSPAAPAGDQTCYLASGADLWLWLRNYRKEVEKDPQFAGSLPIRLPSDIGDPAITYTPVKDGIRLPPAAFVSVANRDAFATCWESGRCELAYGLACEAGLTKKDDEHFAQPVMPFYYVRRDRPGTALVPRSVLEDFRFRQGQTG